MAEPDDDTMGLVASVGITDRSGLRQRVRIGEGIAGKVAATCAPFLAADIQETELRHLAVSSRYRTASCIVVPLIVSHPSQKQSRQIGVIAASDKHSAEPFTQQDLDFLSALSAQVSATLEHARLVREMEDGYLGALVALVQACEEIRPETRNHSRRVADLAAAAARELRLPEGRVQLLLKAASLHEIGRLASGPASPSGPQAAVTAGAARSWTPQDVVATDQLLARIPTLREVREIILHSVDRHDAAAPPFEVTCAPIPIESRILSVCEDFSRLEVHAGSGGAAAAQGLEALRAGTGRRHDLDVVEALERVLEREERA
jgi:HD-GYP domain-containing protein (c-di-GMP phosphodiesterase class II)